MGTQAQNRRAARIGGLATSAAHDPRDYTACARESFLARFLTEVDPAGELAEPERVRRAAAARRLHFARLAARSAAVRAQRAGLPERTQDVGAAGALQAPTARTAGGEAADDARPPA